MGGGDPDGTNGGGSNKLAEDIVGVCTYFTSMYLFSLLLHLYDYILCWKQCSDDFFRLKLREVVQIRRIKLSNSMILQQARYLAKCPLRVSNVLMTFSRMLAKDRQLKNQRFLAWH